jgi:hypothetical protein
MIKIRGAMTRHGARVGRRKSTVRVVVVVVAVVDDVDAIGRKVIHVVHLCPNESLPMMMIMMMSDAFHEIFQEGA